MLFPKKPILILLALVALSQLSFAQNNVPGAIVTRLRDYTAKHATEKAYLQFDKPYYAAGDTVYFKAYVTAGERHNLSQLSSALHVDLINPKNKVEKSIKLQIADGVAWGDFALTESLPRGNYRIRAYTLLMLNATNGFFEQVIPVGSSKDGAVPESNTASTNPVKSKADLQFFPEGGNFIAGISNKIAFKAIATNGLGIDVKGVVADNENKTVVFFASTHLGMGSFDMNPEPGKSYHATLNYTDGSQDVIDLPKTQDKGIALSVNNDSVGKTSVTIEANKAFYEENKDKTYLLLIYSGGMVTTVRCKLDYMVTNLDILKRKLFTGITRITLFSPENEPLCERLIFIQKYDQLRLDITPDKTEYQRREKVSINVTAKTRTDSAATGHFSVAVTDEGKVRSNELNETTILSNLLLTSDLKGTVEQPNYYFTNITDKKLSELDLVMLTHGYRKFQWKQVLNDTTDVKNLYQPEQGIEVKGVATNLFGKPLSKAAVTLVTSIGGPVLSQTTDERGNFKFTGLMFTDTAKFILSAATSAGSKNTKLIYNNKPGLDVPVTNEQLPLPRKNVGQDMSAYIDNNRKQLEDIAKNTPPKTRNLDEVKIVDYKTSNILGPGHADQVLHAADIDNLGGPLSTRLSGRLLGITIFNGVPYYHNRPMLIMVDNVGTRSLDNISANDIETVEVLTKHVAGSIYGAGAGNGLILLTTKDGKGVAAKDIPSEGVLPIKVKGFYRAREFYSPKYEAATPATRPDLRSTIYWNPEFTTDKDGNASFDFYNADGTGPYKVVVEGMDEKGNIGRMVFRYRVD